MKVPTGLICLAYFVVIAPSAASAGFVQAPISPVDADVQNILIPRIAEFSSTNTGALSDVNMGSATASLLALHALSSRNGIRASPGCSGFGPVVNASFQSEGHFVFDYAANFCGQQQNWVSVTLTVALGGSLTSTNVGGATAQVFAQGNVYSAPNFAAGLPGGIGNGVSTSSNLGLAAGEVVSISCWVPRGTTISTSSSLEVTSYTNPGGSVVSDFSGSFEFNPAEYADAGEPGSTVPAFFRFQVGPLRKFGILTCFAADSRHHCLTPGSTYS